MQLYILIKNKLVNCNIVMFILVPSDKNIRLLALEKEMLYNHFLELICFNDMRKK